MIQKIDAPITTRPGAVSRIVGQPSSRHSSLDIARQRVARSGAAIAKRAHPIIFVFAIFGGILAATIALRLAIWLPLSFLLKAT